jgi:hypothetical protein
MLICFPDYHPRSKRQEDTAVEYVSFLSSMKRYHNSFGTHFTDKIPSPASLADWGMSDDGSDGDERGLGMLYSMFINEQI